MTNDQPFLCLNMIVKNEAHVIGDTLKKLLEKVKIDYYVISDTGSTDDTKAIIKNFFDTKGIQGEIYDDPWKDFGYNRSKALEHAYKKSSYLLIHDADDEIGGELVLPPISKHDPQTGQALLEHDCYLFQFGDANGISYYRIQLINNHKKWKYTGVLHEAIGCLEPNYTQTVLEGKYWTISGKSGSRSKDPEKYYKDALILAKAYEECKANQDSIYNRYGFYCANSYKDAGKPLEAIEWYLKVLDNQNWVQEKYVSCINLFYAYRKIGEQQKGMFYLVQSFAYDKERLECVGELVSYYCVNGMCDMAFKYYEMVQDFYENKFLESPMQDKLFMDTSKGNFYLPYYMIIVSERIKKYETGVKMYRIIFSKKHWDHNEQMVANNLYNLQFFLDKINPTEKEEFAKLFQEYLVFLKSKDFPLYKYDFLLNYESFLGVQIPIEKPQPKFTPEECKESNKILFYTGYSYTGWNYTFSLSNALGGSESAVCYLANQFPKNFEIYITGGVAEETYDNIHFVNFDHMKELIQNNAFHTIIISRYVAFYEMYPYFSAYQTFIWGHDIILFPYGCSLNVNQILQKWNDKITACVCQTEWHQNLFLGLYPELKEKMKVINNGIKTELFCFANVKKPNRFLYSSCTERGLGKLLQLWPEISARLQNAELMICSYNDFPRNDDEIQMKCIIDNTSNIHHLGKMSPLKLYELMSTVDYWLYPSYFQETSCITSLEMLASKVVCLYYPVAGLVNTLGDYGIPIKEGNEIETLMSLTESQKETLRNKGRQYAMNCSWKDRAKCWFDIIYPDFQKKKPKFSTKIVNMKRRLDRKEALEKLLQNANMTSYEFVEAVDGELLKPNEELRLLFERNDNQYKRGVLGCALSHIQLWKQLTLDLENDFYIILEDDITLCENFKEKLDYCVEQFIEQNLEHLGLGEYNTAKILNQDLNKLEIVEKDPYKIWNITFAYIISKSAAQKLINFMNKCSVKSAIDNVQSYGYVIRYHTLNELIVHGQFVNNSFGSDIQSSSLLLFDSKIETPKTIKISFCDWWQTEYCGGIFDGNNNFFTNLLKKYSLDKKIEFVPHHQQPDILFYSIFGNQHSQYTTPRKIFFCGEPYPNRKEADFNLTFDKNDENNIRLPLWLCYTNTFLLEECDRRKNGIVNAPKNRKGFCSFIASGPGLENNREDFVKKLSAYKTVDCGGNYLNNIGHSVPLGIEGSGKIKHNENYKFAMAFESKSYPGYVTEKICDIYKSKCIPIYWGTQDVIIDFNPSTFINANDFKDWDELVEYIKKVDNDDQIYESYFKEPFFSNMWMDIFKDPNHTFNKNVADCILGKHTKLVDNALKKLEKFPQLREIFNKNEKWAVLVDPLFKIQILEDYINVYKDLFDIVLIDNVSKIDSSFDKILGVDLNCMNRAMDKIQDISKIHHLNVEQLHLKSNIELIQKIVERFPDCNIYDYSQTNLRILQNQGFDQKLIFMSYFDSEKEIKYLKNLQQEIKTFDFGIIHYTKQLYCPRRIEICETLKNLGFSVHIVDGFGEKRDAELGKCKVILNIHSTPTKEPNRIFEHLRCNRLLYAGYKILSEDNCDDMDLDFLKEHAKNLKFLNYRDFKNKAKIIELFPELGDSISMKIFSIWHHKIFDHCYEKLDKKSLSKICMFDVNPSYKKEFNKDKNYEIIREYELPSYDHTLQVTNYCQTSCFYHVYKNKLYNNYSYVGFIQYDMELEKDFVTDLEYNIHKNPETIFYNMAIGYGGKVEYEKLCEPYSNSVLEQYNNFFKTNYTIHSILKNPLSKDFVCLHTFVITCKLFEKMMKWFCSIMDWLYINYMNKYYSSPMSDLSEAIFGLFLLLERIQNSQMGFLPMKLVHEWPKLHDQTEFNNYKQGNLYFSLQQLASKTENNNKIEKYEKLFRERQFTTQSVLEIGNKQCHSLKLWNDYFVNAKIYGTGTQFPEYLSHYSRINYKVGNTTSQEIVDFYKTIGLFDIIIDNGPHSLNTVENYLQLLQRNGILVINDNIDKNLFNEWKQNVPFHLQKYITINENMFIVKNCVDKLQFKYGVENNLVDVSKRVEKLSNNWIYISKDKNTLFGDPVPMVEKYLQVFDCEKLLHSIPENDFGFFNSVSHELVLNKIPSIPYVSNNLWIFYGFDQHNYNVLEDYITSLQSKYQIKYTKDSVFARSCYPKKLSFIMYIQNQEIIQHYNNDSSIEISFLNTEPLSIRNNLNIVKEYRKLYPTWPIYDYSLENIEILVQNGISQNVYHLPYLCSPKEIDYLTRLNKNMEKDFDYGFIVHGNTKTNTIDAIITKRRKNVIKHLLDQGFSVHIISGWGVDRDREIARCRTILNIHGEQHTNVSTNFEHIRCDRLLEAGFRILSEQSLHLGQDFQDKYQNLSLIRYDDFFQIKKSTIPLLEFLTQHYHISAWLGHLEFAMKLVELVKPNVIAELGVDYAHSTFAWGFHAQGQVYGIDCFEGDPQAGFSDKKQEILKTKHYLINSGILKVDNIKLIKGYFDDVAPHFHEKIDILHINGLHTYETIKNDYNTWISKTTENAVIVFHDVTSYPNDVGKLFAEIQHSKFYYQHSAGLGIACKNYSTFKKLLKADLPYKNRIIYCAKKYCFIHSCHLADKGTKRLEYLVKTLKESGILETLEKVYINNIGLPIDNNFGEKFVVTNESLDSSLHEIPTLNKIKEFSKTNPNSYILYLHTKGISWPDDYQNENDWIDMMLYFLVHRFRQCISKLNKGYETLGCNYTTKAHGKEIPHYSGNFWWAKAEYLDQLNSLSPKSHRNDAEFWLMKQKPNWYCVFDSKVDHYKTRYPKEKYVGNNYVFEYGTEELKTDVTEIVYQKCWTKIIIPLDKNCMFGDPCFMVEKFVFVKDKVYKENEIIELNYQENLDIYYGTHSLKINVTQIVLDQCIIEFNIPENKNELFGDPVPGQVKKLWIYHLNKIHVKDETDIFRLPFIDQPKKYCFIHSCHLEKSGTKKLENLVTRIKNSNLLDNIEHVYINNIGLPLQNTFGSKFIVNNYSENPFLYEIPTLNKILEFSKNNPNSYILYLHTKGIRYVDDYIEENDWIDMMSYFLIDHNKNCFTKLDEGYETTGCNFVHYRHHFSGNFWWAKSDYLSKLDPLDEINPIKNEAEFWLFFKSPKFYCLHSSNVNHYSTRYPKELYYSNKFIIQYGNDEKRIDVTEIVYNECSQLEIPENKNQLFGDPCFGEKKNVFIGEKIYNENEKVCIENSKNLEIFYGTEDCKINVTEICKEKSPSLIIIPKHKNELFGDPLPGIEKNIYIQDSFGNSYQYKEHDSIIIDINQNKVYLDHLTKLSFFEPKRFSCSNLLQLGTSNKQWKEYFIRADIEQLDSNFEEICLTLEKKTFDVIVCSVNCLKTIYYLTENSALFLKSNGWLIFENLENVEKVASFIPCQCTFIEHENCFIIQKIVD